MQLSDFDYFLPEHLIARYPLPERSASRLLQLDKKTGVICHSFFTDLPNLLTAKDLLVFNNTRVIPARLFGVKVSGGKVEVLVERILDNNHVLAHIRASKAPKLHSELILAESFRATVVKRHDALFELAFDTQKPLLELLEQHGHIPLPPYLAREDEQLDKARYQTIYAEHAGAVAAPTAGLHFDAALMQRLQDKKINMDFLTLHVGAGTFQPVRVENILDHQMHAEYFDVSAELCKKIKATKRKGGRIVAVGTTTVRALETVAQTGEIKPYQGDTSIFIYPSYEFRLVDAMITNFHLPKSSLLMLVSAFAGHANIMAAYQHAIASEYRFYSYGDAMFIS